MSKIELNNITGGYNLSQINDNFSKVENALNQKVLWRDNPTEEPNHMKNDLDMNGKRIYNLGKPSLDSEAVRLGDVKDLIKLNNLLPDMDELQADIDKVLSAQDETMKARDEAVAAASAAGVSIFKDTYADLLQAVQAGDVVEGDVVMVFQDEGYQGSTSYYQIEGGVPVFKLNLDKLRFDLQNPDNGELIKGAAVGYKTYTTVTDLSEVAGKKFPLGTEFKLIPAGTIFTVMDAPAKRADVYSYMIEPGRYAVAKDVLPTANMGVMDSSFLVNCPLLGEYLSVQNALYDQTSQQLVLTLAKAVSGGEVGAISVHNFNGTIVSDPLFTISDVPAGHFSYTALQRKGNDLWLWFQHYLPNSSDRGIGRIKVAPGSTPELMIPAILTNGVGHSSLTLGSYGLDGIWFSKSNVNSIKEYLSFEDMEAGIFNPQPLPDKNIVAVTGAYMYQTAYESDGAWTLLTGMYSSATRNEADSEIVRFDGKTDQVMRWPNILPDNLNTSLANLEPQAIFSRWNGSTYDVFVVNHNFSDKTKPSIFPVSRRGSSTASIPAPPPWIRPDWRSANWSASLTPPHTLGRAFVPVLETDRSIVTPGIFIGGNNTGVTSTFKADPTLFRITQTYGGRANPDVSSRRELYEIVGGRNEVVQSWVGNSDSINIAQEVLTITQEVDSNGTLVQCKNIFNPTFGNILGRTGYITKEHMLKGLDGAFRQGGYSTYARSYGFSFLAPGSGSNNAGFTSYMPIGRGLDFAAVGPNNGIKFGTIQINNAVDTSTVVSSAEWYRMASGAFHSSTDNNKTLGTGSNRWSVIYAGTGTINTSDERNKQQWRSIDQRESEAALEIKNVIKAFKFNDAVDNKGEKARWHFGVGAQTVAEILNKHGLIPDHYAFWCYDEWDAEYEKVEVLDVDGQPTGDVVNGKLLRKAGSRYGIRYDELAMFILAAI